MLDEGFPGGCPLERRRLVNAFEAQPLAPATDGLRLITSLSALTAGLAPCSGPLDGSPDPDLVLHPDHLLLVGRAHPRANAEAGGWMDGWMDG